MEGKYIRLPVKGYEGIYEADTEGNIWSIDRKQIFKGTESIRHGRKLCPHQSNSGYLYVTLAKNNKKQSVLVHRIIAETFLPNLNRLPQVNHKDENKLNNSIENLEWCDAKYNTNYGTGTIRRSISQKNDKNKSIQTAMFSLDGLLVGLFPSAREAARDTGIPKTLIYKCCRGENKTARGYKFKYITK